MPVAHISHELEGYAPLELPDEGFKLSHPPQKSCATDLCPNADDMLAAEGWILTFVSPNLLCGLRLE